MVVWRGVQGGCGVFFQIYSKTYSNCLPVVDSPECAVRGGVVYSEFCSAPWFVIVVG